MEILSYNNDNNDNNNYEYKVIIEAVNNSPNIRLRLYRALNFIEEKEAFDHIKNSNELLILYTVRSNHRYYFGKFGEKILQIITNNDYEIYAVRNMNREFEGF